MCGWEKKKRNFYNLVVEYWRERERVHLFLLPDYFAGEVETVILRHNVD